MFIIEKLTVHTSEEKQKRQFITVQHTSGHVKASTVYDHHARPAPPRIDSIIFLILLLGIVLHSCCNIWRVEWGSEVEVIAVAHVYPAHPIYVQWDSSPAIWKAM
jgi:hypothetical protein